MLCAKLSRCCYPGTLEVLCTSICDVSVESFGRNGKIVGALRAFGAHGVLHLFVR